MSTAPSVLAALTANGGATGIITIADTSGIRKEATVYLYSNTVASKTLQVVDVLSATTFSVKDPSKNQYTYFDASAYLTADTAKISQPVQQLFFQNSQIVGDDVGDIVDTSGFVRFDVSTPSNKAIGVAADSATAVANILDNSVTLATTGAKLLSVRNNSTEKGYFDAVTNMFSAVGTQPTSVASGAGITSNYNGDLRTGNLKITMTFAAFQVAATTKDITIATIPAKTRVLRIVSDTTVAFAGTAGTLAIVVGKTVGGSEYIVSHDVKTAAITKGLIDTDLGTSLTRATAVQGGDLTSAMWTSSTNLSIRLTSGSGNLSGLTGGSVTIYLTLEYL